MIAILVNEVTSALSSVTFAADSSGTPWLLALGPAGAGGVYYGLWQYYRNTGKSHDFEHETRIEGQPATGTDTKVNEVKGTTKSRIDGDNHSSHRKRVQRFE